MQKIAGYRLHLKRLGFPTPGSSIRTIKYQLGNSYSKTKATYNRTELEDSFAEAIKHDYEKLYGAFNFKTYFDNGCSDLYSLKEFWLDCLRAGAIMRPTEAKLLSDLRIISGREEKLDNQQKNLMLVKNPNFVKCINFGKFKDEIILPLLKRGARKNKKTLNFFLDKEKNKAFISEILTNIVGKTVGEQIQYWCENYGVDINLYVSEDKIKATSFYLLPQIPKSYNQDIILSPTQIIDNTERKLQDLFKSDINIEEYIGLSDSQGGLSQVFGYIFEKLINNQVLEIKDQLLSMSSLWDSQEDELFDRLAFLSKQAKKIATQPKLVNNWSDYRTDFGGKIQSWISNSRRQDGEIAQSLFGNLNKEYRSEYKNKERFAHPDHRSGGHKQELENILQLNLEDFIDKENKQELLNNCQDLATELLRILQTFRDNHTIDKGFDFQYNILEDYSNILAELRSQLNLLYQLSDTAKNNLIQLNNSKKTFLRADEIYKSLFKELENIPAFLGYTKTEKGGIYEKYIESLPRLYVGMNFLEKSLQKDFNLIPQDNSSEVLEDKIRQCLQKLLDRLRIISNQSSVSKKRLQTPNDKRTGTNISKQILIKILNTFSELEINQIEAQQYFYQSPYKRRPLDNKYQLKLRYTNQALLDQVPALLKSMRIDWGKYKDPSQYLQEWLEFIEITKIRTGLLASTYDLSEIIFDSEMKKHFVKIDIIAQRFADDIDNTRAINTIIQTAILSEMRGTISKMTTTSMINRYVVQPINSEVKFRLITEISDPSVARNNNQSYYIHYPQSTSIYDKSAGEFSTLNSKEIKDGLKIAKKINKAELIRLNSSKYHMQFLDNSLSGSWAQYQPILASYSFIYEEYCEIEWQSNSPIPNIKTRDNYNLFVAIPFNITGNIIKSNADLKFGSKFLGLDVGEYGLATYVLDINDPKKVNFSTSFISDQSLRKIRYGISSNKIKQQIGTFSNPQTYIKALRRQAITSIRNQVHALTLQTQAIPVYEYSISNFETKSGKISKIYNSVKLADIFRASGVNKLERQLVWGKNKPQIAEEISAYATSYSCSKCHRSLYEFTDNVDYTIVGNEEKYGSDEIVLIEVNGERLRGFVKNDNQFLGKKLNFLEARKSFQAYARPPYKFLELVSLRDNQLIDQYYVKIPHEFKKNFREDIDKNDIVLQYYAGSQAIFRCPFVGCGHIADADLQAAMWIALKGYISHLTGIYLDKKKTNRKLTRREEDLLIGIYNGLPKSTKTENSNKAKPHIPLESLLQCARKLEIPFIDFDIRRRLPK